MDHQQRWFFKLAIVKSVKMAYVCIVFFFHYFKYYGQNILSRITVLYLIAKVERKLLLLESERKEAKCFRLRR